MKEHIYLKQLLITICLGLFTSCGDLDIPPMDVVKDEDLFNSEGGIKTYFAALYERLPIEDFRFSTDQKDGFNHYNNNIPLANNTGEEISRRATGIKNPARGYWTNAYMPIRYINHFFETFPQYTSNYSASTIDAFNGEAYFLRAYIYFALVKRYGGVPILKETQSYPEQSLEELQLPRNTEFEVYDFIAEDLNKAIQLLPETSIERGRANKYIAAALKSRAMLFAGSIAKYGTYPDSRCPAVGIPKERANEYFQLSFEASKMLEGKYSLHRGNSDKFTNFTEIFLSATTTECIFAKEYQYPNNGHCFDALHIPASLKGPQGYSSSFCPTLDFVEMFDGLNLDEHGRLITKDKAGNCIYFEDRMEPFKNAEPRLRATVLLPGDKFKNQIIDVRRGIYTGPIDQGIKYSDDLTVNPFINNNLCKRGVSENNNQLVDIGNGKQMTASGADGYFDNRGIGTITGFHIRKFLDPNLPTASVHLPNYSTQPWIDMRYAEILLNRAEAAIEMYIGGHSISGVDLQKDAFDCINDIRDRAGAVLLNNTSEVNIEVVRKERKKELAFENKTWWDLRRWRIADTELNQRIFYVLHPYYVKENGKYVFLRRLDERNSRYNFNVLWYYEAIPSSEINKNPNLLPNNPGY